MSRERKQNIISLKEGRRGCGWVPSARWRKRVSSACPFSESSIHTWNTSWEPRGPSRWRITAPGEHRRESRFLKSPERQAHHLCQLHPWWAPLEGDACLWTGGWSPPPPGPGHPQELCCWAGPCNPCLQGPPALTGPAEARPHPPHGPQPHSDSGTSPPQHQAATRGQTRTGGVGRSWSKGTKLHYVGRVSLQFVTLHPLLEKH